MDAALASPPPARALLEAERVVAAIDRAVARQLNAIMHHPRFQALEAAWLGVAMLLRTAGNNPDVKLRLWNVSWAELAKNIARSAEFDQSRLFDLVYSDEFGAPGGEPFGLLVGVYDVSHAHVPGGGDPIGTLGAIAGTAAAAFAPFLCAAAPALLDLEAFADLDRVLDLSPGLSAPTLARWDSLRGTEDTRFVGLVAPRILMRAPHAGPTRHRIDGFAFAEDIGPDGEGLLWGNGAFAVAAVVVRHFIETGWFADIRGAPQDLDGGGLVPTIAPYDYGTDCHGLSHQPPVEVRLTPLQEHQLAEFGVMTVATLYLSDRLVLNTNPSLHRPRVYDRPAARQNARLAAMLQYVMCASRFAHYLKVLMRDKVGRVADAAVLQRELAAWLSDYTLGNDDAELDLRARHPLRSAGVEVVDLPGRPGAYGCTIHLQPHFQLDDVSTSFQLVAETAEAALAARASPAVQFAS